MSADPLDVAEAAIPSLLGPGAHFEGLLSFRGFARVEGTLEGEVRARGRLFIGPQAHVKARIEVDELVVAGTLEGEICVRERTELQASASVQGNLTTPRLRVAEGSVLNARLATGAKVCGDAPSIPVEPAHHVGSA